MIRKFHTKGKYENGVLKLNEILDLSEGTYVEVIILNIDDLNNSDIETSDIMKLSETSGSFDFLNDPREDGYTLDDLKIRYK